MVIKNCLHCFTVISFSILTFLIQTCQKLSWVKSPCFEPLSKYCRICIFSHNVKQHLSSFYYIESIQHVAYYKKSYWIFLVNCLYSMGLHASQSHTPICDCMVVTLVLFRCFSVSYYHFKFLQDITKII